MALLCASALAAQSSDFTDRVTEMLFLEASERLELPVAQIEMIHLGLNNVSCPDDAESLFTFLLPRTFEEASMVLWKQPTAVNAAENGKPRVDWRSINPHLVAETATSPGHWSKCLKKCSL